MVTTTIFALTYATTVTVISFRNFIERVAYKGSFYLDVGSVSDEIWASLVEAECSVRFEEVEPVACERRSGLGRAATEERGGARLWCWPHFSMDFGGSVARAAVGGPLASDSGESLMRIDLGGAAALSGGGPSALAAWRRRASSVRIMEVEPTALTIVSEHGGDKQTRAEMAVTWRAPTRLGRHSERWGLTRFGVAADLTTWL